MRMLIRTSKPGVLSDVRLQCQLGYDAITKIASSLTPPVDLHQLLHFAQ